MTQRARTRIQRLKDEEAALSYRFARHLAESQEEDSLGLRNGENRQPCHDPGGEGEGRETTILCRRCPCTKHRDESSMNNPDRHARSRPPNERNSRGIPRGYVAQFGLGENSVDRYSRIGIVFRPPRKFSRQWGQKFNGD